MKTTILTPIFAAALAAAIVNPPTVLAEDAVKSAPTVEDAAADGRFFEMATRANLAIDETAELAQSRTKREDVKALAKRLEKDHSDIGQNIQNLAKKLNIKLPTERGGDYDAKYERLKKANDADFDRVFLEDMVTEHKALILFYENTATNSKHPEVKALAANSLGHLKKHLLEVQGLQKGLAPIAEGAK